MSLAQLIDISALVLGLYSAVFFAVGVWTIKDTTLETIAVSMWEPGRTIAKELTLQKADFIFGAVFLLLSFALQLASKTLPLTNETFVSSRLLGTSIGFALPTLICAASLLLWKYVRRKRMEILEKIIVEKG